MARFPVSRSTAVTGVAPAQSFGTPANVAAPIAQGMQSLGASLGQVGDALIAADERQKAKDLEFRKKAALIEYKKNLALMEDDAVASTDATGEDLPDRIVQGSSALIDQTMAQFGEDEAEDLRLQMQSMGNDSLVRSHRVRSGMRAKASALVINQVVDDTATELEVRPDESVMETAMDEIDSLAYSTPYLKDSERDELVAEAHSMYANAFIKGVAANGTVDDVDDLDARIRQGSFDDVLTKEQTRQHLASLTASRSAHDVALRDAAADITEVVATGASPADERLVMAYHDQIKDPRIQAQVMADYARAKGSQQIMNITKKTPLSTGEAAYNALVAVDTEGMTASELAAHQERISGAKKALTEEATKRNKDPGQASIDSYPENAQFLTGFNAAMTQGNEVAASENLQMFIEKQIASFQMMGMSGSLFPEQFNEQMRAQFEQSSDIDEVVNTYRQLKAVSGRYYPEVVSSLFKEDAAKWAYTLDSIGSKHTANFINGTQDYNGELTRYKEANGIKDATWSMDKSTYHEKLQVIADTIRPSVDGSAENYTDGLRDSFIGAALNMVNKGQADDVGDALDVLIEDFGTRNTTHGNVLIENVQVSNPGAMPGKLDALQGFVAAELRRPDSPLYKAFAEAGSIPPETAADQLVMYNNESGTGVVFLVDGKAGLPLEGPMFASDPTSDTGYSQSGQRAVEFNFSWIDSSIPSMDVGRTTTGAGRTATGPSRQDVINARMQEGRSNFSSEITSRYTILGAQLGGE